MISRQNATCGKLKDGPRLGLVCITAGQAVRYRTMTRTRLLRLSAAEQCQALGELYEDNLSRLLRALDFCDQHNIRLYRATSSLFPLCDEDAGVEMLGRLASRLSEVGTKAERLGIRVVQHPDQFVVLSSDEPKVIDTSIRIMQRHMRVLDYLGLPRSSWSALILHGGKGGRADRLVRVISELPDGIRLRLALENDDRAYSASEILKVCQRVSVPMVFDAHHHLLREGLDDYEDPSMAWFVDASCETWPDPSWHLVHLSNGRSGIHDPRHSDLITLVPSAFERVPWIEVEAKGKELAIEHLRQSWPAAR